MRLDTIAAISTAYGTAAISVIRVSGCESIEKINEIFKGKDLTKVKSHTINYGFILDANNKPIDEVMVTVLKGPKSFTSEDMIEISTHGGILVTQKVLMRVLETGIRLARPGEFTERAFIYGRIDLTKSEAIMDLISAKNEQAMKLALNALQGQTKDLILNLKTQLLEIITIIELNINYPEYDDEVVLTTEIIKPKIEKYIENLEHIINESDKGRLIREGVNTAIIGKPNVGKSSLLNALLDEERAIVTNIAGTTRDTIEESVNIKGITLNLIDTAGIRDSEDLVENIGIDRSKQAIEKAELVILVLDASQELSDDDLKLLNLTKDKQRIIVGNKKDLGLSVDLSEIVLLSALKKEGINVLKEKIVNKLALVDINKEYNYLSNIRHINKLEEAKKHLYNSLQAINNKFPIDIIELDLKNAWQELGEIIGEYRPDELIEQLFSKFCLGK